MDYDCPQLNGCRGEKGKGESGERERNSKEEEEKKAAREQC